MSNVKITRKVSVASAVAAAAAYPDGVTHERERETFGEGVHCVEAGLVGPIAKGIASST